MNIVQLRRVFRASESLQRAAGNAEVADGLATFANLLECGKSSETVAAFVKRVEKARNKLLSKEQPRKMRPKK